jgi:hypothetical protein
MGILDFMGDGEADPRTQAARAMAQSLLGRGGGLQRLAGGLGNYGSVMEVLKNQELKRKLAEAQIAETEAQAENRRQLTIAAQQRQAEAFRAQAEQEAFLRKHSAVKGTDANAMSGVAGPRPEVAALIGQRPAIDPFEAMRVFGPEMAPKIMDAQNLGMPEVARTIDSVDAKGNKVILQFDKHGRPVGSGVSAYVKPELVDTGGRKTFALPTAGAAFDVTMDPSQRDASARGWAGLRQAESHFNTTRNDAAEGSAKSPPGYRWNLEKTALEAIPGGPADNKATATAAKDEQRIKGNVETANNVLDTVAEAKVMVGPTTAGVGGLMAKLPITEARNLAGKLETIKANLGFDRLQQMREVSPTGGALGQVAVQELQALQATVASLDQLQSPAQLSQALSKIERHYTNWLGTVGGERRRTPDVNVGMKFQDPGKESRYQEWVRSQGGGRR